MDLTQKTQDWGNSTGIRLPKKALTAAKWNVVQEVTVNVRGRSIILTPKQSKPGSSLEQLVENITPANKHEMMDWVYAVGKEAW